MIWLINLSLIAGLAYLAFLPWRGTASAWAYWPGLSLKLIAGLAVGWLYTNYYSGGDTTLFFESALALTQQATVNYWQYINSFFSIDFWFGITNYSGQARTGVFSQWLSILVIISGGSYWLTALWCSFLSFLGVFYLITRLNLCFNYSGSAAVWAFLLWPSIAFWSSGVLKESLCYGAFAVIVGAALSIVYGKKLNGLQFALLLISILFLWRIKYYVAVPLLLALFSLMVMRLAKGRGLSVYIAIVSSIFLVAYWLSLTHPYLQTPYILKALVENYNNYPLSAELGSYAEFSELKPTWISFLLSAPVLAFSGLYLPLPYIPFRLNAIQMVLSMENLVWLGLTGAAFVRLYKVRYVSGGYPAVIALVYATAVACAMVVASPVFGSLVRYRVYYLPVALFVVLYYLFPDNKLPKLRKVRTFADLWKIRL